MKADRTFIKLNISGIKCDNPECDYRNSSVKLSEYEYVLNAPCPSCGEILLTQEDYERTIRLVEIVNKLNRIIGKILFWHPGLQTGDNVASARVNLHKKTAFHNFKYNDKYNPD